MLWNPCNRFRPPRPCGSETARCLEPTAPLRREQLAGFYLVRDLNEVIQVASKIPPARVGSIEVRLVRASR